jgi:hypothetical protein
MNMKTKFLVAITLGIFMLTSCSELESDEFCNDPNAKCPVTSVDIEANSCCTDQDCYWTYNGTKYNCDGDDCEAAINAIISSACASAYANIDINIKDYDLLRAQMQGATDKLLLEAREASGCAY